MRTKNCLKWAVFLLLLFTGSEAQARSVPLVDAVKNADRAAVRALVQKRVDVNAPEPDGTTALHWAARLNDSQTVELLVRAGANVKAANRYGATPLCLACINGSASVIELLLKAGADANAALPDGETALMTAARTGNVDAVHVLVAAGIGTSSPQEDPGIEPEVLAAVKLALELGGDINAVDKNGETAMHGAAYKHVPSVVRFLAEKGEKMEIWNRPNKREWTPLRIVEGIPVGMNIAGDAATRAAIREIMTKEK